MSTEDNEHDAVNDSSSDENLFTAENRQIEDEQLETGDTPQKPEGELEDAGNKEIFAYAAGGLAGEFAGSAMHLKQYILMFVLCLNPILVSFIGAFGMLWDSITDPIMANISDNSKNKWGRRRPFILVGGILAALFSVVIWWFLPRTDAIQPNKPLIPEVIQSTDALVKFGKMMKGYGIGDVAVRLDIPQIDATESNEKKEELENPADSIEVILKESFKVMEAGVRLSDDESALAVRIETRNFDRSLVDKDPIGQNLDVTMTLDSIRVHNAVAIMPEYEEDRSFGTILEDFFKGRDEYIGLAHDGESIDFTQNTFRDEAVYRARVSALEKSIIETLGQYYRLPYWKCFPKNDDGGERLRLELSTSNLEEKEESGLQAEDKVAFNAVFDSMVAKVEKRNRYLIIREAIKQKTITPAVEEYLQRDNLEGFEQKRIENNPKLSDNVKEEAVNQAIAVRQEELRKAFKKGTFSKTLAGIINKEWLQVTDKDIAMARTRLAEGTKESTYEQYVSLHTKFLLYGLGHKMDLEQYALSEEGQKIVDGLLQEKGLVNIHDLYASLWQQLDEPENEKRKGKEGSWGNPQFTVPDEVLGRFFAVKIKAKQLSFIGKMSEGFKVFFDQSHDSDEEQARSAKEKQVVIYLILMLIVFATVRTINGVPYYALGIELAPSYDGRTKVIAYRSVMSKIIALKNPFLMPFVLLPCFTDAIEGALWLAVFFAGISIPMLIYSVMCTKERIVLSKKKKSIPFIKSIKDTVGIPEFWRIVFLYFIMQKSIGIFTMVGNYLTIYYVFGGALLKGMTYTAFVGVVGYGLALISVPLVTWICNRFEKHNALRFSIIMMMIGCLLKWWCYDPEHPEYLFIVPIFFSIGIAAMYTVMGTLMADVTDVDELKTGSRREGMFGAVNSLIMKATSPIAGIIGGVVVVVSGFEIDTGAYQEEGVFTNLRVLFSIFPAVLLGGALLLLYKYPLTRARMEEIKAILVKRRAAEKEKEAEEEE